MASAGRPPAWAQSVDIVEARLPTYAEEVVADPVVGCGLEGVLAERADAFSGILNGVDYAAWNPASRSVSSKPGSTSSSR